MRAAALLFTLLLIFFSVLDYGILLDFAAEISQSSGSGSTSLVAHSHRQGSCQPYIVELDLGNFVSAPLFRSEVFAEDPHCPPLCCHGCSQLALCLVSSRCQGHLLPLRSLWHQLAGFSPASGAPQVASAQIQTPQESELHWRLVWSRAGRGMARTQNSSLSTCTGCQVACEASEGQATLKEIYWPAGSSSGAGLGLECHSGCTDNVQLCQRQS